MDGRAVWEELFEPALFGLAVATRCVDGGSVI